MKRVIIEVPDNWHPHFCGLCHPHECNGARGCPVPDGKEVTPVRIQSMRSDRGLLRITLDPVLKEGTHMEIFVVEDK